MSEEIDDELPRPKGDLALIEAVVEHWEQYLGPCVMVYDEIVSEFVHIDVYEFGPDPSTGVTTFVTSGMAEKPMNVPGTMRNPENFRYAELILQVSPSWMQTIGGAPFFRTWPIRELKTFARMPHKYESWAWAGHTMATNPPTPFSPETQLCASVLWPSYLMDPSAARMTMPDGRQIEFLTLGFLYAEELAYKKKHQQDGFEEYIDTCDVNFEEFLILTPNRPNVCAPQPKKPWWKLGK